jgi:hypothetical protein
LKSSSAKAFAVSVLPTQVGPKNRKDPSGFDSSFNQALALLIAFDTALIAFSCQTTCLDKYSSICRSLSFSFSISFEAGIQVHLDIISAISSSVTLSFRKLFPFSCNSPSHFSIFSISFSSVGISPYLIFATLAKSVFLSRSSASILKLSIFSLVSFILIIISFSLLQACSSLVASSFLLAIFFDISSKTSLLIQSSFFLASNSISKVLISFCKISSSTGFEIEFIFTLDNASSIKSIALSGSFLSDIYFIDKSTAASIAESVIFIP